MQINLFLIVAEVVVNETLIRNPEINPGDILRTCRMLSELNINQLITTTEELVMLYLPCGDSYLVVPWMFTAYFSAICEQQRAVLSRLFNAAL